MSKLSHLPNDFRTLVTDTVRQLDATQLQEAVYKMRFARMCGQLTAHQERVFVEELMRRVKEKVLL